MKVFLKIIFWTFWLALGFVLHGSFLSYFDDKEARPGFIVFLVLWWGITIIIAAVFVKMKMYRKNHPAMTKEQKQRLKQLKKEREYRHSAEYKKKYISEVAIENSYFGNGVLVKDSSPENNCYTGIKSGFDRHFDSFGQKSHGSCDLYEFIVKEDNIEYVLASLEKIYKKADQIMGVCYDEIYKEIVGFFEVDYGNGQSLKKDFNLAYLKENWYVYGIAVYDDYVEFTIGIDAAENPEDDHNYNIIITVDYAAQEPSVSFNVVW